LSPPEATPPAEAPAAVRRRRRTLAGWLVLFAVVMVALVAIVGVGTRYGVLLPQARALIEARTSGLKIGRFGRLKVEGLAGDIWSNFTIRRLTIYDEKGTWLAADNVTVKWRYLTLLKRKLTIDQLRAQRVQVLRRPTLSPKGVSRAAPLSIVVRDAALRVETLPAFSVRRGLFDARFNLDMDRAGGQSGDVFLTSLLHRGDFLRGEFAIAKLKPFLIDVQAAESQGGALAGAAGLPSDRPFSAKVLARGTPGSGVITVRVFSGNEMPAQADGAWTAAGGDVKGRANLGASTLLKSYVQMFGPDVRFALAARKAGNTGLHGVAARVRAENLVFAGNGLANLARRSAPQGLNVDARVPDLKRILKSRLLGAGRAVGKVNGSPQDWRFRGVTTVDGVELGGFSLVRISGPLVMQMRNRELRAQATLQGGGGQGKGMLGGLVGRAPRLFVDLTRFPDGRVLVRDMRLVGAGFTLTGSGSRGILGALNFKGDLAVPNMAVAKMGAAGGLKASFTASQGGGAKPWLVTLDSRGERFRSGVSQLDRLLGPSPRLRATAAFQKGLLSIGSSNLSGLNADANAKGTVGVNGAMKLAVDWRAKGPFAAGPVEIAGNISGKGAVSGSFAQPRADLTAHLAALDLPKLPLRDVNVALRFEKIAKVFDGVIAINGASDYGPARARSAFRFMPGGVDLSAIDADAAGVQAAGAVSLRGNAPTTADLKVAIGPGLLLARGQASGTVRIVKGGGPASASVQLTAQDAVVRGSAVSLKSARLTATGPLDRLPYQLTAQGQTGVTPFSVDGSGVYAQRDRLQTVSFLGKGEVRKVAFRTAEPVIVQFGPEGRSLRAHIVTASGGAVIDARDSKGQLTANASLDDVDLKIFGPDFVGRIDAKVAVQGKGERLTGTMRAMLAGANVVDSPADQAVNGRLDADLADSRVTVHADLSNAAGLRAKADVALPTVASASPMRIAIVRNGQMSGDFDVQGEVKPLWDIFFGGDRSLRGQVAMSGTLGGTLNDPTVRGQASMTNGQLEEYTTGLKLTNLQASAQLGRDTITVTSLTANDNKQGKVAGSGTLSLQRGGASDLTFQLTNFRLIDNDTATANASGKITAVRAADGKVGITGELSIDRAEINAETKLRPGVVSMDVIEVNRPPALATQMAAPKARGPSIALDVRLRAPRRVFVEGRGIRAELSVFAHVTGTVARPNLEGTARVVDGFYDFAGRRFQFEQRGSIRLSNNPADIYIDLSATASDPSLSVTIQIRGNAAKPDITLASSPALPQDEILARLLFGGGASQLSTAQAAQVASVLSSLSAGGGFDVLGNLREFAGLDRLAFGADQTGALTVAGGKYVGDNIYLEVVGGGVYGPTAQVEWRVKRNFSIVSTLGGQFGAKMAVRWRRDIGRDRRRRDAPPSQGGVIAPPPPNRND
jgi:translocation and assembly module TamB